MRPATKEEIQKWKEEWKNNNINAIIKMLSSVSFMDFQKVTTLPCGEEEGYIELILERNNIVFRFDLHGNFTDIINKRPKIKNESKN